MGTSAAFRGWEGGADTRAQPHTDTGNPAHSPALHSQQPTFRVPLDPRQQLLCPGIPKPKTLELHSLSIFNTKFFYQRCWGFFFLLNAPR